MVGLIVTSLPLNRRKVCAFERVISKRIDEKKQLSKNNFLILIKAFRHQSKLN